MNLSRAIRILLFLSLIVSVCLPVSGDTWIRSNIILTLADGEAEPVDGFLHIGDDGTLISVLAGEPKPATDDKVVDATGKIVIPGFLSGHNHLWQSAFRGIASDKELYGWLENLHWTYGEHFQKRDMYYFTLYGALDQLMHGITTTLNHSQNVAPTYADYIEQFEAEMDAGQHFVFSYILDANEDSQIVRKAKLVDLIDDTEALTTPHPCLDFGIHGTGMYFSLDRHKEEIAVAKELGLDMQVHYLEEKAQSLGDGQAKFNDYFAKDGLWDGLVYAHFIHVTDNILTSSIDAGAKMVWNPLSNGRLASGLADITKYLDAGLAVGMGVDGAASADICDPFQNMRMGMYALRMRDSSADAMSCYDILRLHTLKTAEVLKVDDRVGSLEAGKLADFLIIEPSSPIFDPYATLAMATSASDVESVWVRGKQKTQSGKLLTHDLKAIKTEVSSRVARIRQAADTTP